MPEEVISETVRPILVHLAKSAWEVREAGHVYGPTKVGCALITASGEIFTGCNVEHRFRSHDIHAEVNAITTMVASGAKDITAMVIAAERERFTPCGACMDWIMQFAASGCIIGFQSRKRGAITTYTAHQLMPFYPA